jgi:hypothetical protein
MPHELIAGLEAAALMILVLLLVPKRGLDHLRARFSDLQAGRRRWLFDPRSWMGGRRSEGVQKLARDAVEAFELGVPLFVAGRLAEQRSAQLHMERQSHWTDSPKAILAAHLKGALSELELHGRLNSRELPLPAAKAVLAKVEARPLISIKWWLERQAMAHAMAESNGQGTRERVEVVTAAEEGDDEDIDEEPVDLASASATTDPGHLRIRTFGRLQLLQAGHDYGPALMSKKVLAFIWLYLFVRRLLDPDAHVKRAAFAEEYSPGLSPIRQNKRLRDRLGDMYKRDLAPPLSSRIIADRQQLRLDLSNCSIDIVRLQEVASLCSDTKGMLTSDLVAEARRMLEESEGEFLQGWDEIEAETNGGRGEAHEYVHAARELAETARVDLMGALAANHMARQEPRKAIPLLERALEHQPEREDLARKLVAAYMETGQHARAAELQKEHSLNT